MSSLSGELITGDGRTITVGDVVDLYRKNVNLLTPIAGEVKSHGKDTLSLIVKSSAVNYEANETVRSFKIYSVQMKKMPGGAECIEYVRPVSGIHETTELASASSKNGRFQATLKASLKNQATKSPTDRQVLLIYDCNRLVRTFDISEIVDHGSINTDEMFSSFVWSPFGQQDKLLYVCQPKRGKQSSYFDIVKTESEVLGEEFVAREDWGEALDGIEHTIIGIIDVSDNFKVTTIDVKDYSLSSSQWLDNGTKVVSAAYKEKPRKLGVIYCNNRESSIMIHDWRTGKLVQEISTRPKECHHSPRVNNSGDKFVFLSNPALGVHNHSTRMNLYDLRSGTTKSLADGLFIQDLPTNCFTTDDKYVLLKTHDHLYHHLCLYSLEHSKLVELTFPTSGISILDFHHDIILASGSQIDSTPTIYVASVNTSNIDDVVAWHQIEDCTHLDEVEYEPYKLTTPDQSTFVSAVLVRPNLTALARYYGDSAPKHGDASHQPIIDKDLPTVVIVHGGPNSAFLVSYTPVCVLYARLGLKTLLINYRGSSGVSEEYLEILCGKIGTVDVDDCLHVIRYLVSNGSINPSKLIIQGGSHGGFLACHLSCQDEFKFKCAIIRNPVVDLARLFATSDIPDWTATFALGSTPGYNDCSLPDGKDLAKMFECSPMSMYKKAHVPTLMLLGTKDRRVNMYQGERWVDILRARGIEASCKVYPDKHDLAKPQVAADSIVTAVIWILKYSHK